jgi:hypothetical protein
VSGVAQISDKLRLTFGWAFSFACSNARDTCCELKESKMRSDPTLKKHYNRINKKFFHGELPQNVCVRWLDPDEEEIELEDKLFGYAGLAKDGYHKYQIVLSKKLNGPASSRFTTLVHECIHVFLELRDDHGAAFERVRVLLSKRGIYKKNALIRGATIF